MHEQREMVHRLHDELKLLNEQLSTEKRKVKSLEREGDRLRSEISLLESKVRKKIISCFSHVLWCWFSLFFFGSVSAYIGTW